MYKTVDTYLAASRYHKISICARRDGAYLADLGGQLLDRRYNLGKARDDTLRVQIDARHHQ